MDTLKITALNIPATIGVHGWEQRIKQHLLLDIVIRFDASQCHDALEHTIDYDGLCQKITQHVESKSFQLIETVANEVALLVRQDDKVQQVVVSVSTPHAIKNAGPVCVTVER